MSRPTHFELMRGNRRHWAKHGPQRLATLQQQIDEIEHAMQDEWRAQRVAAAMDDPYMSEQQPRRWWWPPNWSPV